jgi:hypothetical protein
MPDIVLSYEMLIFPATADMLVTSTSREYFHVAFQNGKSMQLMVVVV